MIKHTTEYFFMAIMLRIICSAELPQTPMGTANVFFVDQAAGGGE
jgi:hypothetical protein